MSDYSILCIYVQLASVDVFLLGARRAEQIQHLLATNDFSHSEFNIKEIYGNSYYCVYLIGFRGDYCSHLLRINLHSEQQRDDGRILWNFAALAFFLWRVIDSIWLLQLHRIYVQENVFTGKFATSARTHLRHAKLINLVHLVLIAIQIFASASSNG